MESYSWEAKAAIILAGFASNLGFYCLVAQLYEESHPFAKSLALLQLPPNILKQSSLKAKFEELLEIFEVVLGLIKDTVTVKIQSQSVSENYLVKAVSLITQSIVACASEMLSLVAKGIGYVSLLYIYGAKLIHFIAFIAKEKMFLYYIYIWGKINSIYIYVKILKLCCLLLGIKQQNRWSENFLA